ncbi:DUF1868 domain-containing protein [Albimonas pacifica]|uniref:DUF1868 domain-containing protein n=1 Tax=Albimonas pacifica TaxID=1114924 RepID=A0A1I3C0F1_9RHOB|nr:DUF1868 domain-containing protein [Albimonas pacifica]SFH67923.1 hypothetical protein SAMN05216258_101475 [Albimonas pacifica]
MRLTDALAARQGEAAPTYLGLRFDARGDALPDPGSTIVAHVREPAANAALATVRATMEAAGLARFWAWLPPSSFHMTMFDMVLHGRRGAAWPRHLPQDLPGREADAAVVEAVRGFALDTDPVFRMTPRSLTLSPSGMGVTLTGETPAEDARLRALRDRLAAATGLAERPGHADYRFHITLAYLIDWPAPEDAREADAMLSEAESALLAALPTLRLGPPEVCLFDDMTEFRPLFTLS